MFQLIGVVYFCLLLVFYCFLKLMKYLQFQYLFEWTSNELLKLIWINGQIIISNIIVVLRSMKVVAEGWTGIQKSSLNITGIWIDNKLSDQLNYLGLVEFVFWNSRASTPNRKVTFQMNFILEVIFIHL